VRITAGILLMASFVLITFGLLVRYAGGWGVPYFTFTTDRGSVCTNDFTGYTCDQLTLADIEFYGDVNLPDNTVVVDGVYRATHDYALDALLQVPRRSADAALRGLHEAYGRCIPDQPPPLETADLRASCVLANDVAATRASEVDRRLYIVGTGLRKDRVQVISLSIKSR